MIKTKKKFDAVAMMRATRDRISAAIEGMTLEEELNWLASQEINDPYLKRLRDRAAQSAPRELTQQASSRVPHRAVPVIHGRSARSEE